MYVTYSNESILFAILIFLFKVIKDDYLLEQHCSLQNFNGLVTLLPNQNASCVLNKIEIKEATKLSQGDLIILGANVFRFNHPEEAAKLRERKQVLIIFFF